MVLLLLAMVGTAQELEGSWEATVQILPSVSIYSSVLTLKYSFATDWSIESESKVYSGAFKYQNFYLDGKFGDWDVWGKIYFSVQDVRYQKLWVNFEMPLPGEDNYLRLSVNHWASEDDYWSSDKDMFGPWPCDVITWDKAKDHYHETLHVQGPVVSVYVSGGGSVTIHIGKDYPDPDRFDIYIPASYVDDFKAVFGSDFPDNLVGKTVCIYGYIKTYHGIYEIESHDPEDLSIGPCCGTPNALGPLMIYRAKAVMQPLTLTLDLADCCTGIHFKKLELELEGMSLCCGVLYDLDLAFSKCHGFEYLKLTLDDLFDLCCNVSVGAEVEFGVDYKKVSIVPSWQNIEGCVSIWGDVDLSGNSFTGWELYGFGFTCAFGDVEVTEVTALNPEKIEDLTDYSFYEDEGEFEYLSLEYGFSSCCGGEGSFQTQFWFGNKTMLFGLQRVRFDLEVPVSENISFIAKTQLKLWETSPIQWFDIGWTIEF